MSLYQFYVRMCDDGLFDLGNLEDLANYNYQPYEPDAEGNLDKEQLYQYASIRFAQAVVEKKDAQYPYSERFRELVENAKQDLLRLRQASKVKAEHPEADGLGFEEREIDVFEGLVDLELFRLKMADGDYEEALDMLATGMVLIDVVDFSTGPVIDLKPEEAVYCFERLKAERRKVKDWVDVKNSCAIIHHFWELCGLDPDEQALEDHLGGVWTAEEYWVHAATFAEAQLTPNELLKLKEIEDRKRAEDHLRLFFEGCWDTLPDIAKDALIQADVLWWATSPSSKSSVVDNLWKAAVEIVKKNLWVKFVEYVRSQPPNELLTELNRLSAKWGWEPGLNDFVQLMWKQPLFVDFLRSVNMPQKEQRFLLDANTPRQLSELNNLKNRSMHFTDVRTITVGEVSWAYRTCIGVGCEGILPRLARLKR